MRALKLLRTQAFRIVLVYLVLFAISVATVVAFTYWNTKRALDAQTDQIIEAESTGLSEQYQRQGLQGLTDVIVSRSSRGGPGLYLLTDHMGQVIAGNLDGWPKVKAHDGDLVEFNYVRRNGEQNEQRRARGRSFALAGGFDLLVARDVHERYETEHLFSRTLPWSIGLMVLLGLVGGALVSRNILARLDTINRTSRDIVAGNLSRRVPVTKAGDEFDELAKNLNRMLDRIERLMKGMREVTDSVAHDLRSPLNRLRNRLEGALNRADRESEQSHSIELAVEETDAIIATFNALLLIAEAEAGVAREAMTLTDLGAVVEGVVELYSPVAEEKSLVLSLDAKTGILLQGNQNLLSQALANLIDNAIKYTPVGGTVRVSLEETADNVELSVSDTGAGIPAEARARVIDRFVRLEPSRNTPGTGLGLSLVAAVARLHDASFELSDNGPGLKAVIRFPRGRARMPSVK
ncbi:MAG TPA: HAMP domain-containing sensor histidine kinase [Rhizomicrobium sp.]|nr:HAMP domain-containing sensor histidine kinase [Rhizomicrobium sp.]